MQGPRVLVYTFKLNTWEMETDWSLWVLGQPGQRDPLSFFKINKQKQKKHHQASKTTTTTHTNTQTHRHSYTKENKNIQNLQISNKNDSIYDLWLTLARRPSWSFVIDISWSYKFKDNLRKHSKMCCLSYLPYFCLCFVCLHCLAKKTTHKIFQHHWTAGSLLWSLCFPIDYKKKIELLQVCQLRAVILLISSIRSFICLWQAFIICLCENDVSSDLGNMFWQVQRRRCRQGWAGWGRRNLEERERGVDVWV